MKIKQSKVRRKSAHRIEKKNQVNIFERSIAIVTASVGAVVAILQVVLLANQTNLLKNQNEILKNQSAPHFAISEYNTLSEKVSNSVVDQIESENFHIRNEGGFATNVFIEPFAIISLNELDTGNEILKFGVWNYVSRIRSSGSDDKEWNAVSDNNFKLIRGYNLKLNGMLYRGKRIESLAIRLYFKISYENQFDEDVTEYYLISDFDRRKISFAEGEAAQNEYSSCVVGDLEHDFSRSFQIWLDKEKKQ